MAGRKPRGGKAPAAKREKPARERLHGDRARAHTPTPAGSRVRSRFAGLKFWEPPSKAEVERLRKERAPGPWGLVKPGQWASSLCGCAGQWMQKGDGLWWKPTKPCEAHAGQQMLPLTPPSPELRAALETGWGDLWPLPCRLCGAKTHAGHKWDCVFWAINDRTPFDTRGPDGEAQHEGRKEAVEAGADARNGGDAAGG